MPDVSAYRADAPTTTQLLGGAGRLSEVVNLRPVLEGGLASVRSPVPLYFRNNPLLGQPDFTSAPTDTALAIGYAELRQGQKKVLLAVDGSSVKVWRWHTQSWYTLIGPDGSGADIEADIGAPAFTRWHPSFVPTARGIVIVLPGNRAYFYDGVKVGYLGFSEQPTAPIGLGPQSSTDNGAVTTAPSPHLPGTNDTGYVSDGLQGWEFSAHPMFGSGRLGTVEVDLGQQSAKATAPGAAALGGGSLLPGRYRCRVQHLDAWGNLSAASPPSNDVLFDAQPAISVPHRFSSVAKTVRWARADLARKRVGWASVSKGPPGTVARLLYRTKDLVNSGDAGYYELPQDAVGVPGALGTLPDNLTEVYPDNIPDAWLGAPIVEVEAVPRFNVAAYAFDRLWIANFEGDNAALMPSLVGRYGTFAAGSRRYPSAEGRPITGLKATAAGLLAMTSTSTHLYRPTDDGQDFVMTTLSTTVGCEAPQSIQVLDDGSVVWLGKDGFYGLVGGQVQFLWAAHRSLALEHVTSRLAKAVSVYEPSAREYRCWVPVRGSHIPNRCYTFDGAAWRWREDTHARGACVASGDVYVAGIEASSGDENYWVLDKGTSLPLSTVIQTAWLSRQDPFRFSVVRVHVRLRETCSDPPTARSQTAVLSLEASRDYRDEVVATAETKLVPDVQNTAVRASVWGYDNADDMAMRDRRPFWVHMELLVSSAEAVRLRLSTTGRPVEITELLVDFELKEPTSGRELR